jgi:hypothetical protein
LSKRRNCANPWHFALSVTDQPNTFPIEGIDFKTVEVEKLNKARFDYFLVDFDRK